MTQIDYTVELNYDPEDAPLGDDTPVPSTMDIETWIVDGMHRAGLSPASRITAERQ